MENITRKEKVRNAVRRFRAKINADLDKKKEILRRDAERKRRERRTKRLILNENEKLLKEQRKKDTTRKRIYREKIKNARLEMKQEKLGPYKSCQTLGKALCKVKKALPCKPEYKETVLRELLKNINTNTSNQQGSNIKNRNIGISDNEQKLVENFFFRDDVSRQAPGKRDVKSLKNSTGQKEVFQIQHMVMTIKEAYSLFKEEYPNSVIHISKFYTLRPKYVLLSSQTPHNVCVCRYHANFNYLVESIYNKYPNIFPRYGNDLLKEICCELTNEICMLNNCNACEKHLENLLPLNSLAQTNTAMIKWKPWKDVAGRPQLLVTEGSLLVALSLLEQQLPTYKFHCFVKANQEKYFKIRKDNLKDTEVLIQIDFAENFSLVAQDEIQSAHWSHQQVTLFTCVAWFQNCTRSFVIISDELSHDKYAVFVFKKKN